MNTDTTNCWGQEIIGNNQTWSLFQGSVKGFHDVIEEIQWEGIYDWIDYRSLNYFK